MPKEVNITTKRFQWDFMITPKRFPGMVAGWGTGKTMCALYRGIDLSKRYDNNLGAVIRKKFTDLRDSTMKDFTRYTGIQVPQGTKTAKIGNSEIIFRHAKELSGLQNINLGWFYIEQAEEFATEKQFMLIRGRMRRVLTPRDEVQNKLVDLGIIDFPNGGKIYKLPALRAIVADFQTLSDEAVDTKGVKIFDAEINRNVLERDIAEYALTNILKEPLRHGMVIANAGGHNWVWKQFVKSPGPEYFCSQANTFDNADNLSADFLKDMRDLEFSSPKTHSQYVLNNHDEVDLDACYYADTLTQLRKKKQIASIPHRPDLRVHFSFDIGFDCTAIWFFQILGQRVNIIDYYENTGKAIKHYVSEFDRRKRDFGYNYGKVVMPHDAKKREMTSGTTLSRSMKDMGYDVISLPRVQNLDFAINQVINFLPRCWFDEKKCELGLEALQHYRRKYDEELQTFLEKPLHDWASHPASSFKELVTAVNNGIFGKSTTVTKEQLSKWAEKYRRVG